MDRAWRIQMFGGLRAERGDKAIARFRTQKMGALLAYLAFHSECSHPREVLIEVVWPGIDPPAGRLNLRVALHSIRRHLEPPGPPRGSVLFADHASVQLNPDAIETDVAEFEEALESAAHAPMTVEKIAFLSAAIDLYRGDLLPGFYQDWILTEQRRLADLYFDAVRRLAGYHAKEQDWNCALDLARRAVALDPLREEAHQDLMRLLAAAGQPAAALQQYEELKRVLLEELNAAPHPSSRTLARRIREAPKSERPSAPPGRTGRDEEVPRVGRPTGTVTFLLAKAAVRGSVGGEQKGATESAFRESRDILLKRLAGYGGWPFQEAADSLSRAKGEPQKARSLLEEALALSRETGNRRWEAVNLHNLGRLAAAGGEAMACSCLSRSLEIAAELGDQRAVAATLEQFCAVCLSKDEPETAAELLGAAAALREMIGAPLPPRERVEHDRSIATVRSALGEEVFDSAWESGRAMTMGEAVALALSLAFASSC